MGHIVFIFAQEAHGYEDTEPFVFRYSSFGIPKFDYSLPIPVSIFVNKLLPSLKLDVIHSNHPNLLGDAAANKAEEFNLPLVFTFHTRYVEYSHYVPLNQAFVKGLIVDGLARYMRRCQHIVTPSDSIKQTLAEHGVTEQVTTIPTGIDLKPFQEADAQAIRQKYNWGQDKILVSIGRLAKEKNWTTLLSAVAQVMDKHDDVQLALIGDGPQREELENYAQELGIAERVEFIGLVPFAEVPNYLTAADIFCFASVTETQGLVTMEAMAAGLPVVAVDATGTSDEVEDGKEGLLTDNESTALAQAVHKVLDDEALLARLKQGATKKARYFDMMAQAKKMLAVYEQAIEDKKANQFIKVDIKGVKERIKQHIGI
jgi:glycosyltransferase involved in cell wall biosynthesis